MENEIQIGEYIRTDKGNIGKLTEIRKSFDLDKKVCRDLYELDKKGVICTFLPYIKKHSFNIIDLIEVGDVLEFKEDNLIAIMGFNDDWKEEFENLIEKINNREIELLSILTKEQYSQKSYKVVE